MEKGSFHWNNSYLSWHCYTSIIGLGSEVHWETLAGQVGVLSWCHGWPRGSKRWGQERTSCELAWGEILHFLSFWHCDFLMADWSFTNFLFCGTTSCSLCLGKRKCQEAAKERGSCMNTVQMAISPEARDSGLESEVKNGHQGLWRTLCSSSKGPGHAKVM